MKRLAAALIVVGILAHPVAINAKPKPNFFTRQPWEEGYCSGRQDRKSGIRYITYAREKDGNREADKAKPLTTETTMPALDEGERILGKECSKEATLVLTNKQLLVYPGADVLFFDPVETRRYWVYAFDKNVLEFSIGSGLGVAVLFEDGNLYVGGVDPEEEEVHWKKVGSAKEPTNVQKIELGESILTVYYKNGKKEKFRL